MTEQAEFQPFIDAAKRLSAEDIDSHVSKTRVVYYGDTPAGTVTEERLNHPAIVVEDESGKTNYSVLISGDLLEAKRLMVKPMSWSDHPGRGFEALRQALIADDDEGLAVIGISFPGAGLNSPRMTSKQKESLSKKGGSFKFIGSQQWTAIQKALELELAELGIPQDRIAQRIKDYEVVLSGSSQGASNSIGLLESLPDGVSVPGLAIAQNTSFDPRGRVNFIWDFIAHGSKNFKGYTEVNPYNEYPALGPGHSLVNVLRSPAAHITAVVNAMRGGGSADKIMAAIVEKDLKGFSLTFGSAELDGLSPSITHERALKKLERGLGPTRLALARTIVWGGHYHPVMENLSNAQHAFRDLAR